MKSEVESKLQQEFGGHIVELQTRTAEEEAARKAADDRLLAVTEELTNDLATLNKGTRCAVTYGSERWATACCYLLLLGRSVTGGAAARLSI